MPAVEKYYRGRYALCARCGSKPCICPPPADTPAAPIPIAPAPASGNAIPFVIWDRLIALYALSLVESSVLLFLCRLTIGYGHHSGDLISVGQIEQGLRIGRATVKRALDRLDELELIERTHRLERGGKEFAITHIRVTLPAL